MDRIYVGILASGIVGCVSYFVGQSPNIIIKLLGSFSFIASVIIFALCLTINTFRG